MKKKIYLYFRLVGIKFDLINHPFKLDSCIYFVQDTNNNEIRRCFKKDPDPMKKVMDPDPAG